MQNPHLIPHPAGAGRTQRSISHLPGRSGQGLGGAGGTLPVPKSRPHKSPPRPQGRSRTPLALLLLLPFPSLSYKPTSTSPRLSPTAPTRAPSLPLYLVPLGVGSEGLGFYPRDELLHPVLGAPRHSPAPREMTAGFDILQLISCSFQHPRRNPVSKSTPRHHSLAILLLLAPSHPEERLSPRNKYLLTKLQVSQASHLLFFQRHLALTPELG